LPGAGGPEARPPQIEKARQVFRFLKAFAERNVPMPMRVGSQLWQLAFRELPTHPTIEVGDVILSTVTEVSEEGSSKPLLRVRRPVLSKCPAPPAVLREWLLTGWDDPQKEAKHQSTLNVIKRNEPITERFEADPQRVVAFAQWKTTRQKWVETEAPARAAMAVFERLFNLRARVERESQTVELMLGNGRLRWRTPSGDVDHPILLQRVELTFDPSGPEIAIHDADRAPELYGSAMVAGEGLSALQLDAFRKELEKNGLHPLAVDGTKAFLQRIAQSWSHGTFEAAYKDGAISEDPVILHDPVLFLRNRVSGFPAAFDQVLATLESSDDLPVSLTRLVGVESAPASDVTAAVLRSPWGEPPDVLLSKPANPEQVQIARALEEHHAVLVQGPPGTGKSHTIANLIGHLVAQGKRVLVTSHATKALRVLREQVVESLRPLCVAVLDHDLESRVQMEQSVKGILTRLTQSNPAMLQHEVDSLATKREALNQEIDRISVQLEEARAVEYRPIVLAGESVDPSEAARWTRSHFSGNDWIPGPVEAGAPLPLSPEDLRSLYESNGRISVAEEAQIDEELPDPAALPSKDQFTALVGAALGGDAAENAGFWSGPAREEDLPRLEHFGNAVQSLAAELGRFAPWQRTLVAAGHAGSTERAMWEGLARLVNDCHERWRKTRPLLLDHPVACAVDLPLPRLREQVAAILAHVSQGGGLGWFQLAFRKEWKAILEGSTVSRATPGTAVHFRALSAHLDLREGRERLAEKWRSLAEPAGLPKYQSMGPDPEATLKDLANQFSGLCSWWPRQWEAIQKLAQEAGFRWQAFRDWHVARSGAKAPFERDAALIEGPLLQVVSGRVAAAHALRSQRELQGLGSMLLRHRGAPAIATQRAVSDLSTTAYAEAYDELNRLAGKLGVWRDRRDLLRRLGHAAPTWADVIRSRVDVHGAPALPGDAAVAWRWGQLRQEIDRRAALDERSLVALLHQRRAELRSATADLIDRKAWLRQSVRTDLPARQALQGWADTTKKIGKGTGKRAPALQAEARTLLLKARDAVPVWIMPLARVAESFVPGATRFDVVIVDEASQSDVTGLLAWFLGERIAIVGDHEQVSPMAVGQDVTAMADLIEQYLVGIPNSHLYDGRTSIYDLARQCFGGTIALREHFRCVPDIIEFSNELSYNFDIRPLRNPGSAERPHVVEHIVSPDLGSAREGKENLAEARTIAALIKAATELPEYAGKSIGAITLLGDDQAWLIHELTVSLVDAIELEKRRFISGNAAQFQGDERHVMFLSMVDTPTGGFLKMSQLEATKQRFNVAASRAKDQLWLVHSLDPGRDLQPGDLRRRLIEYARDPGARRREMQRAKSRAESPLEAEIIQRLVARGYSVHPQVWVGEYRIDMVIRDGNREAAVECDGDRFHGLDQIAHDMRRQAVLERAGWRFVRVRGTRFFKDPEGTIDWLCDELARLEVKPVSVAASSPAPNAGDLALRDRVLLRAREVMRELGWLPPVVDLSSPMPHLDDAAPMS
jgi:very-short-patch-repair endonuclease